MKVLLINPYVNQEDALGEFGKFWVPMPPINLAYIAAVLEKNSIEVEVIDGMAEKIDENGILEIVKNKKPRLVGMSCLTQSAPIVFSIAKKIKRLNKNILIVLGNVHASVFSEEILDNRIADIVIHGEGEYTMLELVQTIENNDDLNNVKGISFRENGHIIHTKPRSPIKKLDELPFPAWHLFPVKKYKLVHFASLKNPAMIVSGSRGCPYKCTFCCRKIMGNIRRKRSAENIADEIDYLVKNFGIKQVAFSDPIFPFGKQEGFEFCDEMIRRGLNKKVVWVSEMRTDIVDGELLRRMKEAGCRRIMYGFESGVQLLLSNVQKTCKSEDAFKAVMLAREAGIETVGFFMLGLPGETLETITQTIEFAKELDVDFAKFNITVPYPGTELYEKLIKEGKLHACDWEKFTPYSSNPDNLAWAPDGMSTDELFYLQRKAVFEFYMRPKIILRHLFKTRMFSPMELMHGASILLSHLMKRIIRKN